MNCLFRFHWVCSNRIVYVKTSSTLFVLFVSLMPELHWYCRSNLERLLWLCGIGLSENWKSSWCSSIVAQDYVGIFWRSNNFCFIWLNKSTSDFIKADESVWSIWVWQLLIRTFWLWPFIHFDDGLSHILIMTLKRIVTGSSSDEPRLDPFSDFPLKYHCQTGSENCDGSCDARPENWVVKDDHLKMMSKCGGFGEHCFILTWSM